MTLFLTWQLLLTSIQKHSHARIAAEHYVRDEMHVFMSGWDACVYVHERCLCLCAWVNAGVLS